MRQRHTIGTALLLLGTGVLGCGGGTTSSSADTTSRARSAAPSATVDAGVDAADDEADVTTYEHEPVVDASVPTAEDAGTVPDGSRTGDDAREQRRRVARGRRTFDRVCGTCHPDGDEDIGPRLIGARISIASMTQQIRHGKGKMKPIPPARLPESEMDGLMAYLASIRAVRAPSRE